MRELGHDLFLETHPEKGHRWQDANADELENLSVRFSTGMSGNWKDVWGVGWAISSEDYTPFPASHPIASIEDVDRYELPDPQRSGIEAKASENALYKERYLISGWHDWGIFCLGWLLLGMENFMTGLVTNPRAIESLLERIGDFHVDIAGQYVRSGVEMGMMADDYGTQRSLMISPRQWRRFIKPQLDRVIRVYKDAGAFFYQHSCGHIMELVDDLVELDVDVLNPVQARANDLRKMRAQTEGKTTLHGGIDTQYTMMHGTPEDVIRETKDRILTLGENGGYLCAPDQFMPFPEENIAAMVDAAKEYGRYPLCR
jgi:uroporphyrinogen decarboxylase